MEQFEKDGHKIIFGDAIEALKKIPNGTIDLIFIDPPYNIGKNFSGLKDKWVSDNDYLNWCYTWIDLCIDKLKSNCCVSRILRKSIASLTCIVGNRL